MASCAQERDSESDNDYALARFYINRFGRFSCVDPLEGKPADPQSWNRYVYVRDDPINMTDPSGMGWLSWLIRIALAVISVITHVPLFLPVLRKKSVHDEFIGANLRHRQGCCHQRTRGMLVSPMRTAHSLLRLVFILFSLAQDALRFLLLGTRSSAAIKAENIFLRKQLALYLEREIKPRRASDATRLSLVLLSRLFAWQTALINVKPGTFLRWHRKGFRLLWRWKSRPRGRPRVPGRLQELIFKMAQENATWGEERIAAELLLKLGIRVSPRTVRRYMPLDIGPSKHVPSQQWMTFVRNHAQAMWACDFFIVVTARFRILYVFVVMEVGTRRIAHFNVTDHPTAAWTLQQFREVVTGEQSYRFVIHDRDSIYSSELDSALKSLGVTVLRTPFRAPQANTFCERLVGTIRRECLDFLIPLNERHVRRILKEWVVHYNQGRPHSSLGPGIPDPRGNQQVKTCGHHIPIDHRVVTKAILGRLHHEYRLERRAA
ncbi:MAG TPA: integrase core domain-containing protein [Candidatus Dormibacteraeota bacterium]|nr:integrase core domain-containing protein [Candidatus Dormibacteraeota bacterium]